MKSMSNQCRIDVESMPTRPLRREGRGGFEGGVPPPPRGDLCLTPCKPTDDFQNAPCMAVVWTMPCFGTQRIVGFHRNLDCTSSQSSEGQSSFSLHSCRSSSVILCFFTEKFCGKFGRNFVGYSDPQNKSRTSKGLFLMGCGGFSRGKTPHQGVQGTGH